jgi:predicted O-methyltransferase YrrM
VDWTSVIGCSTQEYADRLYARRPDWVQGHISHFDARYLLDRTLNSGARLVVEIGTASGVSTAFLCRALEAAASGGAIQDDFEIWTYDLKERFYADESRAVGDATREMLTPEQLERIVFRNPVTAAAVADDFEPDSLAFVFVDANHRHPWPALDLLALLDVVRPGAEIVLHDINLPVRRPEQADWGAKYLFDELDVKKALDTNDPMPNVGSVWIPDDKAALRAQLRAIVDAHDWEASVWDEVTSRLLT